MLKEPYSKEDTMSVNPSSSLNLFVSDLHGRIERYEKLLRLIKAEKPRRVFVGGDILPHAFSFLARSGPSSQDFLTDYLRPKLLELQNTVAADYPEIYAILGNDDPRREEDGLLELERQGLLYYLHERVIEKNGYSFFGYSCVPPTPFTLKDWERYDVSRFVDVGVVSPEQGFRTVPVDSWTIRYGTIADELNALAGNRDLSRAAFLFHSPPYDTGLDRAALDGVMVDHAPLDVHVGSVAVRRFIEARQPLLTMHGHIHESTRLTGVWRERMGRTWCFNAAHDGAELCVVRFDLTHLDEADRLLL